MWITRTYESIIRPPAPSLALFPVWLLLGARQVGKSSLLTRLAEPERRIINFDDLPTRIRANRDPVLFARELEGGPILLDEIQYAPRVPEAIKPIVDRGVPPGTFWLTGSQNFEVMKGVRESLAGRVAILTLHGLSDEERGAEPSEPATAIWDRILATGFPKLAEVTDQDARDLYLSSYLKTYIERDVRELLGIQKRREFEIFVTMCALRTGQVLNLSELARDAGISAVTAKEWISLLEDSFLIRLVHPWHTNRTKRMIKSAKLYFLDAGLAAWLAGWRNRDQLRFGPMAGALLETHIFGQILRRYHHRAREVTVYFWRTRDGSEIDFLVEYGGLVYPIEVKTGMPSPHDLLRLEAIRSENWMGGHVLSPAVRATQPLRDDWTLRPACDLSFLPV